MPDNTLDVLLSLGFSEGESKDTQNMLEVLKQINSEFSKAKTSITTGDTPGGTTTVNLRPVERELEALSSKLDMYNSVIIANTTFHNASPELRMTQVAEQAKKSKEIANKLISIGGVPRGQTKETWSEKLPQYIEALASNIIESLQKGEVKLAQPKLDLWAKMVGNLSNTDASKINRKIMKYAGEVGIQHEIMPYTHGVAFKPSKTGYLESQQYVWKFGRNIENATAEDLKTLGKIPMTGITKEQEDYMAKILPNLFVDESARKELLARKDLRPIYREDGQVKVRDLGNIFVPQKMKTMWNKSIKDFTKTMKIEEIADLMDVKDIPTNNEDIKTLRNQFNNLITKTGFKFNIPDIAYVESAKVIKELRTDETKMNAYLQKFTDVGAKPSMIEHMRGLIKSDEMEKFLKNNPEYVYDIIQFGLDINRKKQIEDTAKAGKGIVGYGKMLGTSLYEDIASDVTKDIKKADFAKVAKEGTKQIETKYKQIEELKDLIKDKNADINDMRSVLKEFINAFEHKKLGKDPNGNKDVEEDDLGLE